MLYRSEASIPQSILHKTLDRAKRLKPSPVTCPKPTGLVDPHSRKKLVYQLPSKRYIKVMWRLHSLQYLAKMADGDPRELARSPSNAEIDTSAPFQNVKGKQFAK